MFNKGAHGYSPRGLSPAASLILAILLASGGMQAQDKSELQQILQRLDRLEEENHQLAEEVHALRTELAATHGQPAGGESAQAQSVPQTTGSPQAGSAAPLAEREQATEQRVADLSQEKVEASQRFPISLTGMMLFNAFLNGKYAGGAEDPTFASSSVGNAVDGATVAQTILGLRYQSPQALWGARVTGSLFFDFWGGDGGPLTHWARLRTANIQLDWTNTSVSVGQDKPLIAPRDPFSLAQVETSPFTDAGNLWLWSPQVRVEQRFQFGADDGLHAQLSAYQMNPPVNQPTYGPSLSNAYSDYGSAAAIEGRFEYWHHFSEHTRIELAPGFHTAETTEDRFSIPSRLFSFDWFANPWEKIEFTGAFYRGENIAGLGTIGPGYFVYDGIAKPMQSIGGWAQVAWLATPKLTFHLIAGQHDNQHSEVYSDLIFRNEGYAANMVYRVAPNVLFSLEGMQVRTWYAATGVRLNNHYDVGLAYLF
jgi:hypothetical protein